MSKVVLKLLGTVSGQVTEFDHQFVQRYDASYHPPGTRYDGGWLDVTPDIHQAMQFEHAAAALAKWQESYGIRPDGEPNRPLTAWSCEILPIEDEKVEESNVETTQKYAANQFKPEGV